MALMALESMPAPVSARFNWIEKQFMAAHKFKKRFVVRSSEIHGRGVFAKRKIRKGTVIVEYKGKRSSYKEAMTRPHSDPEDAAHTFLFELDDGRVIDARVRGNSARWINHSCDPNCEPFEDEDGRVFIQAKRKIHRGEELAYDYKLQFDGRMSKRERQGFACHCGSPKCRGTLLEMRH